MPAVQAHRLSHQMHLILEVLLKENRGSINNTASYCDSITTVAKVDVFSQSTSSWNHEKTIRRISNDDGFTKKVGKCKVISL